RRGQPRHWPPAFGGALGPGVILCNLVGAQFEEATMVMRWIIGLLAGAAAVIAVVAQAYANGAVATGGITPNSPYGSAFGISYGWETKAKAESEAVKECEKQRGSVGTACEVVADFSHVWASVAIDPKEDTPGFGWAVESDKKTAEDRALFRCRSTS